MLQTVVRAVMFLGIALDAFLVSKFRDSPKAVILRIGTSEPAPDRGIAMTIVVKAVRIPIVRDMLVPVLPRTNAIPQDCTGSPVQAHALIARRQPQATAGRWVIPSTAALATQMVVRQRPDRLWIVSKVCKSGARGSVGASPAKVHAI